jgi:phosphonate transport system permease protein
MSAADVAAWRARLPAAFGATPRTRLVRGLGAAVFLAWLGWALVQFGFTPRRLWNGLEARLWPFSGIEVAERVSG